MNIPSRMWTIYIREDCNYCNMAKAEMIRLGLPFRIVKQNAASKKELWEKLSGPTSWTYPQIFNEKDESIGGFNDLLDYTEQMD